MNLLFGSTIFAVCLLLGILVLIEVGRRVGQRRGKADVEGARAGLGAIEGAIFGLMGLLLAFTFSGAAGRFDARRALIADETNAIGTAWLRLDLLPAETQPEMRELFRKYTDIRAGVYRHIADHQRAASSIAEANALQNAIWSKAVAACKATDDSRAGMLLLPALNQMIDLTTTRATALATHPPLVVYAMLGVLVLASSLMVGFGMSGSKTRSWVHIFCFAAIMAVTVYVIMDLELPRVGFIRIDPADEIMVGLRRSMN